MRLKKNNTRIFRYNSIHSYRQKILYSCLFFLSRYLPREQRLSCLLAYVNTVRKLGCVAKIPSSGKTQAISTPCPKVSMTILLKFTLGVNQFIGFHYWLPYKSLGAAAHNRLLLRSFYPSGKNVSLKPYRSAPLLVFPVYINSSSFETTCKSDRIAYDRKYGLGMSGGLYDLLAPLWGHGNIQLA